VLHDPVANMVISTRNLAGPPDIDIVHEHYTRRWSIARTICQVDAGKRIIQ
jgi:hypothetical protein